MIPTLDYHLTLSVIKSFSDNKIRMPDICFQITFLDGDDCEYDADHIEYIKNKMSERGVNGQMLRGNYLFVDGITPLYAGKAVRLRSRIREHMTRAGWLDRYWELAFSDDGYFLDGVPMVCVWFNEHGRLEFERDLISSLRPVYNVRQE